MRRKLILGFLSIILVLCAVFIFITLNTMSEGEIFNELKDDIVPGAIAMTEMDGSANRIAHETMK